MFVGVQGRLIRPQPLDSGGAQGLVTALCGRYPCLRPVALGSDVTALVLGQDCPTRVLMVAMGQASLYLLRLCEEMGAHLRADLPLCQVSLTRAFAGRQTWFVPLPSSTPHSTAGREELQAFTQKIPENCDSALVALCGRTPFHHAVLVTCGSETVSCLGGDSARLMAQVLSAVSGYAVTSPAQDGFTPWFYHAFRHPALTISVGEGDFESVHATVREAMLLSLLF
jgi:hypothetical protein